MVPVVGRKIVHECVQVFEVVGRDGGAARMAR